MTAPLTAQPVGTPFTPTAAKTTTVQHENRTFLVADRSEFLDYLQRVRTLPVMRTAALHAAPAAPPATFSLAQDQTPIKDQQDRGTCWAFAGAAAVEAAYKRKHKVTLDLSEQYIASMGKVQELAYDDMSTSRTHENNSTLWGFQGSSDVIAKMSLSPVPTEATAPYMTQAQLGQVQAKVAGGDSITSGPQNPLQSVMDAFELRDDVIPPAARADCRYLVTKWAVPSAHDSKTLEGVIAGGTEVVVDIVLDWKVDAAGVYRYDATANGGGHCLVLIGYDRNAQYFLAKNSWGGTAFYKLGYDFIDHCCGGAHYVLDVGDPNAAAQKRAFWGGTWNMDHDGWRGTLFFRRTIDYHAADTNVPIRLGTYVRDGIAHDVNGSFSADGQHCTFYIADDAKRVAPGTLVGQRFDVYCFSWDIGHAAGRTTWNGAPFGAALSRAPLPAAVPGKFSVDKWIGTYAMNHDGWHGTLRITSVAPFAATYTDSKGQAKTVHGTVKDHEVNMTIDFGAPPQAFDLLYSSWETGVFSGTTTWNGQTFGVIGLKA